MSTPSDSTIRVLTSDEYAGALALLGVAFGGPSHPDDERVEIALCEPGRFYGAYAGSRLVGTCGSFGFQMTVPGGPRPVAGVTWVGVSPTDHRRGIATSLMRRQLEDLHAAGEPVAALWASEGAIYQRFGYGPASWSLQATIPSRAAFNRTVEAGPLELIPPTAAELSPAFEHARARRPGYYARSQAWWDYRLHDPEHRRKGGSPLLCVASRSSYGVDGYALYSTAPDWGDGGPKGTVRVRELVAAAPSVTARLWRYLLDLDLMAQVSCPVSVDDALLALLNDPRRAKAVVTDNLWVRLVDVAQALATRSYAAPVDVVLEVTDAFCPWNARRLRLTGGPEGATCAASTDPADLTLDAADLGAAYLGGTTLVSRAAAGRIEEHTPGTLAAASLAFSWPGPAPYCPMVF